MRFHAIRARWRIASKVRPFVSASRFLRAPSTLTKEIPTRTSTRWFFLVSKVTYAPVCAVGPCPGSPNPYRGPDVKMGLSMGSESCADVDSGARDCRVHVPYAANGRLNVATKYSL